MVGWLVGFFFFIVRQTEMPVALTKAAVIFSSSTLPQSLSLSGYGFDHMSRFGASCSWQCCRRCSVGWFDNEFSGWTTAAPAPAAVTALI